MRKIGRAFFSRFLTEIGAVLLICGCTAVNHFGAGGPDALEGVGLGADGRDAGRGASGDFTSDSQGDKIGSGWSKTALDTARNAPYLTDREKDVVLELNKIRANPAAYAENYLELRRRYYQGNLFRKPGRIDLVTNEGVRALDESIRVLKETSPRGVLQPSRGLSEAASDHVRDTGPRGMTGHAGADGSNFAARVSRYGDWGGYIAENISYGPDKARDIVIQLLVDDGVPSRGHRKNILDRKFAYVGVAVGSHRTYGSMCVMDFAAAYDESR